MRSILHRVGAVLALAAAAVLGQACGGNVSQPAGAGGSAGAGAGDPSGTKSTSSGSATSGGGGSGAASTSTSGTGGGACGDCGAFTCCGDTCVNPGNDILHCGGCNQPCVGEVPYCDQGRCGTPPPCTGGACPPNATCCGPVCCKLGELCCAVPGPVGESLGCFAPNEHGTCPTGCLDCKCASPDTPIATPAGERPIAEIAPGDLVYTVRDGGVVAAPVLRVGRERAEHHRVVRVTLETGRVLEISPRHPTADGRTFAELAAGGRLDGIGIVTAELVPYTHAYTYDILPDSDTHAYLAAGAWIGSTLAGR
jgi:hypothetical protein